MIDHDTLGLKSSLMKEFMIGLTIKMEPTWAIQKLQYPFKDQDVVCHISACIGAVILVEDGEDFDTLYRHGDQALYEAKAKISFIRSKERFSFPISK